MTSADLESVIRSSPIVVHTLRHSIARFEPGMPVPASAFAVMRDSLETTVIAPDDAVPAGTGRERGFVLLECRVSQPFEAPGFIAAITGALGGADVNVFPVSTFSRDYVLVRERDLSTALAALSRRGFPIEVDAHAPDGGFR